jgi:hypothetical protein
MAINPLQAPINYAGMVPQINIGQQFSELGQVLAERQKRTQAEEIKKTYAIDLSNAIKNPTQETWSAMIAKYPQYRESFTEARKGYGEVAVTNEFNPGFEVSMALQNGRPDIAQEKLQTIITARTSANLPTGIYQQILDELDLGNTTGAQAGVNYALSMLDPDRFKKIVDARTAAAKAPSEITESAAKAKQAETAAQQKVAELRIKLQDEPIEAERLVIKRDLERAQAEEAQVKARYAEPTAIAGLNKTNWDIKNLDSQIRDRSARLGLEVQTTTANVAEKMSSIQKNINEIPADTRKLINESAVLAATSRQSADQFNDLARQLDESGGGYGVFSSASDFLKKGAGFQGGMTQLRQEYTRLRNTAAIKSLPPGPATDRDIALALRGFPGENASSQDLSNFLRGMAKLQNIDASINNAKTDWLAQNNGTLTRAKSTFVAGDYAANPGETFNDFAQRIVSDVSNRYTQKQAPVANSEIPVPRNSAPIQTPPAQGNIRSQADAILSGGR